MPSGTEPEEEAKPFLSQSLEVIEPYHTCACVKGGRKRNFALQFLPWILSAISWLVMVYFVIQNQSIEGKVLDLLRNTTGITSSPGNQIPENGYFPTDFEDARSAIQYEKRTFTGALSYNETSKRFYRNISTEETQYFGPPSKEIDEAWETNIFKYEWTHMTEDEVQPYLGLPAVKKFNGAYLFETDMLHSLHCLNEVRKRIDIDYYTSPDDGPPLQDDWDRIHIDHCLDQLRQTIICFGDLSPVVLHSWKGAHLGLGQGTEHTCRKWDPINQWVLDRHNVTKGS